MYENLLALHTVDPSNQEVITVEDIYVASESAGTQSASKPAKRSRAPSGEPLGDFIWPLQEEELQEDGCNCNLGSTQSYNQQHDSISVQALFRCVHASLYKGLSVRWSVSQFVGPLVRPSVRP